MASPWMLPPSTTPQVEQHQIASDALQVESGLTRLQLACMDQRISLQILGDMTRIPPPLLSNYALGRRNISRHHLPILAIALAIHPPAELRGYATPAQCYVDEHEMSETNPLPARSARTVHAYPKRPRRRRSDSMKPR